jgi:L-ascorbate metabolism protein UlaG (beta-lactamase superfamily)
MRLPRRRGHVAVLVLAPALALALLLGLAPTPPSTAHAQGGSVTVEWFGWSHFRLTSPNGKIIHTNPFVTGNPDAAISLDDITQVDLILAPNGHGDEIGQTVPIAQKTGARVFSPGGLNGWFIEQGLPQTQIPQRFAAPGDVLRMDGITVRMLNSVHGSELNPASQANPYGGLAASYMITFENGWTVYFSGSSAATADQGLWGEMYKPDAMIFHMGGSHDPLDVAMSIRLMTTNNPNLSTLMPHHHRVDPPPGATTVADVQNALGAMGISIPITNQVRSQVYTFTK